MLGRLGKRAADHASNNWGWYLLCGGGGSFGNYIYCNFATSKRRTTLLGAVEKRLPVNSDELLELRSVNEIHAAALLDVERALIAGRRKIAVDGEVALGELLEALPRLLGREIAEGYGVERMLAAISDNGRARLRVAEAIASLMFISIDSVGERLGGIYSAYSHELQGEGVPLAQARKLVEALLATGQVPLEKRVVEVKRPFYLPNEWEELTADAVMARIPPEDVQDDALSESAFKRFLCSDLVCIWGECYRIAEEAERKKAIELEADRKVNPPWWAFWRSAQPASAEAAAAAE
ncbi:hypothetical protein T492DRAFT_1028491 [Pavlovales sp. CCMP2436]|nr:hypothetical protein T492DRAFT_1028491 [Pavlovales sp. CCMP2436]